MSGVKVERVERHHGVMLLCRINDRNIYRFYSPESPMGVQHDKQVRWFECPGCAPAEARAFAAAIIAVADAVEKEGGK